MSHNRKPDHRHLRRAAEALCGHDDAKDVAVAIQISNAIPFECRVFSAEEIAKEFAAKNSAKDPWVVIPCRTEDPELEKGQQRGFFVVVHDETSPSRPLKPECIDRRNIAGLKLVVSLIEGEPREVDLTAHLGQPEDKDRPRPMVDAIFLSFEALDKYLFPNLVITYGVNGAYELRERTKKKIVDDANTYCKDKDDRGTWRLNV